MLHVNLHIKLKQWFSTTMECYSFGEAFFVDL